VWVSNKGNYKTISLPTGWETMFYTVKIKLYLSKPCRGSRGAAPLILIHGARWWVFNLMPRPLYPRKEQRHPLNRRLGGPQSRSGRFVEEKVCCPYRDANTGPSSPQHSNSLDLHSVDLPEKGTTCLKAYTQTAIKFRVAVWTHQTFQNLT
jgi:hypothetical protein